MIIKYLGYVLRHKWYVLIECWKRGLFWRGLAHDWSKLRPSEFFPYARHFYGPDSHHKDGSHAARGGDDEDAAFDFAWLLHQKRNRHHWQWWMLPEDDGGTKTLQMREPFLAEMLCDWRGAGRAQGHGDDVRPWYEKNGSKMQLHQETREVVEELLGVFASTLLNGITVPHLS